MCPYPLMYLSKNKYFFFVVSHVLFSPVLAVSKMFPRGFMNERCVHSVPHTYRDVLKSVFA